GSRTRGSRHPQGGLLLESLIAVALLSTVLIMALVGLSTASGANASVHKLTIAQNIARSQLEDTLGQPYCAPPCSYLAVDVPDGYSVTADAESFLGADVNLQYVVVEVDFSGQLLVRLKGIKTNR